MEIPIGKIEIVLEGVTLEQTERLRGIIHTLFEQGLFNLRNGYGIMHFDNDGILRELEIHVKKWRNDKPAVLPLKLYDKAKIEIAT